MIYIVVEVKKNHGYVEIIQCSEESDAQKMVAELYRESKERGEHREFKYIELNGRIDIPVEQPRKPMMERVEDKLIKIANR
jgi:hypothetical protein